MSEGSGGREQSGTGPPPGPPGARRFLALGCLMTVAGFFSAGMVAVLIAKIYGAFTHCTPVDAELPACNWEQFAAVGGIFGAISLPTIVLRRLMRPRGEHRDSHL